MEEAINSLKKNGWHISSEKLQKQFQNEVAEEANVKKCFLRDPERWIVDEDLKYVGTPCLPDGINSGKISQLSTPIVLQIKKIENIAAPKQNVESEVAPRMLKVTLTDGKAFCQGIEFEHISRISLKTPPGTKIRLIGTVKVWNGLVLLDAKNLQFLGGEVEDLIEEWKVQQLLMGHVRAKDQDGPPPWVPFGRRIEPINIVEGKDKKTLEEKEKGVQDEGFLSQRQDAIAAAADTSGVTKVIRGSGRQLEMQQTERRGRGRERRERNSYRDEEHSAKPRDSIRLFEFLQPQIGESQKEEAEDSDDPEGYGAGLDEESRPSWERDGVYCRPGRGRPVGDNFSRGRGFFHDRGESNQRGRRGPRGQGGFSHDDSRRDDRHSHRGRGSHQDHDWRGVKTGDNPGRGRSHQNEDHSYRGRGRSHPDEDHSYRGRGQSYQDRRGSSRGGRRGGRGSHRDIEDSYSSQRGYQDYPTSRSPIDALVDDFNAWPGLETKPSSQPSAQVEIRSVASKVQDQWAVEDYCLAKWESSDQHYPAVIQQLHPARKSVTVMFVESGAVRIVETKYLRRDPQDEGDRPVFSSQSRGSQATRIYTPRHRGMGRGW